jgi:hypothetical protein
VFCQTNNLKSKCLHTWRTSCKCPLSRFGPCAVWVRDCTYSPLPQLSSCAAFSHSDLNNIPHSSIEDALTHAFRETAHVRSTFEDFGPRKIGLGTKNIGLGTPRFRCAEREAKLYRLISPWSTSLWGERTSFLTRRY